MLLDRLFVDAVLVGELWGNNTYIGDDGIVKKVTGGAGMNLDGRITLCGRSDLDPTRFFDGRLAYLGEQLSLVQVCGCFYVKRQKLAGCAFAAGIYVLQG